MPGLAPWPSLMLTIFTCGCLQMSSSFWSSSLPSGVRTPYLAVPISNTMSQPPSRWYGASPPSPVSIQMPALAAPIDSARTAGADSAPKLIAEMLKNEEWLYGSRAYGPSVIGLGTTWLWPSEGNGALTKNGRPSACRSRVEPKALVFSTSLAARYTHMRCARLNGISSRSLEYRYWRKNSPRCRNQ